jgi:hypothetical protein
MAIGDHSIVSSTGTTNQSGGDVATSDEHAGGMRIGSVGAFAMGHHNTVTNYEGDGRPQRDALQGELLAAVRELRRDLTRAVATDRTAALDTELAGTEAEIAAEGEAGTATLTRLRRAPADAGAVTAVLASATAVAASVRALLGG